LSQSTANAIEVNNTGASARKKREYMAETRCGRGNCEAV
jgi:hypothetical protein